MLFSVAGAGVGLVLAMWSLRILRASDAWGIARLDEVAINGWVLAFTTMIAVTTGVVTGLAPALRASRGPLAPALREGERGVAGTPRQQRERRLEEPPALAVYLPVYGSGPGIMNFAIHTTAPREALVPMVRAVLSTLDPELPLSNVQTLEEIVSASTAPRRSTAILLGAFAALALVLALVGIYGVTSYAVSRQTAEIGVRRALGASRTHVLHLVLLQGMKPVVLGIGVGLVAAFALSRLLRSLLFGVTAHDPLTYAVVALLLAATAALACIVPARQALRVDIVAALREE